jgi:hypothetical protein
MERKFNSGQSEFNKPVITADIAANELDEIVKEKRLH